MIEGASPWVQALLGTCFTWFLTALGASVVFLIRDRKSLSITNQVNKILPPPPAVKQWTSRIALISIIWYFTGNAIMYQPRICVWSHAVCLLLVSLSPLCGTSQRKWILGYKCCAVFGPSLRGILSWCFVCILKWYLVGENGSSWGK